MRGHGPLMDAHRSISAAASHRCHPHRRDTSPRYAHPGPRTPPPWPVPCRDLIRFMSAILPSNCPIACCSQSRLIGLGVPTVERAWGTRVLESGVGIELQNEYARGRSRYGRSVQHCLGPVSDGAIPRGPRCWLASGLSGISRRVDRFVEGRAGFGPLATARRPLS